MRAGPPGELLAEAGAVAGGSAALAGTVSFVAASRVRDLIPDVDPDRWAPLGAVHRGLAGPVVFVDGAWNPAMSKRSRSP